jgi:hypothetical protein
VSAAASASTSGSVTQRSQTGARCSSCSKSSETMTLASSAPCTPSSVGPFGDVGGAVVETHLRLVHVCEDEVQNQKHESPDGKENEENFGRAIQCQPEWNLDNAQECNESPHPLVELFSSARFSVCRGGRTISLSGILKRSLFFSQR